MKQKILMGYDNRGTVFDGGKYILREINDNYIPEAVELFNNYRKFDLIHYGIVETEFEQTNNILKHKKHIISYPHEWTINMIKDAILFHLSLLIDLDKFSLTLKDAHLNNILFDFYRPVFVDFLSIIYKNKLKEETWLIKNTDSSDLRFIVIDRLFIPYCLIPLMSFINKEYNLGRNLLCERTCNCSDKAPDWADVNPHYIYAFFRKLFRSLNLIFNNKLINMKDFLIKTGVIKLLKRKLTKCSGKTIPYNLQMRDVYKFLNIEKRKDFINFCKELVNIIENIDVTPPYDVSISNYYEDKNEDFDIYDQSKWKIKQKNVYSLLKNIQPSRVLDLGTNTGWFSKLAEANGSEVIAIEVDESCIDKLYLDSKKNRLKILPLKMNFNQLRKEVYGLTYDDPVYKNRDFKKNPLFLQPTERFQSDIVLCLALFHHLILQQGMEIRSVLKILSELTLKVLILEYVDLDDFLITTSKTQFYTYFYNYTKDTYNVNVIISAGKEYFKDVELRDSHPETRKLLVFKK